MNGARSRALTSVRGRAILNVRLKRAFRGDMTRTKIPQPTKDRVVEAATRAIKAHGAAGASARTIAQIGGFNQALIYYYFGSMNALLIAVLDDASNRRLARYQDEVRDIRTVEDLVKVADSLFREDVAAGTVTVLTELVSACLTHPELGPEVVSRLRPWIDLTEGVIKNIAEGTFLEGILPARDLAQALIAFYMGMEMLHHLDGDISRAQRLFNMFATVAPMASPFLGAQPPAEPRKGKSKR